VSAEATLLGLDIGAGHVVMAALDADGRARVVPNSEGDDVTEACLHFYDAEGIVVGREAAEAQYLEPDDVVMDVLGVLANPDHHRRVAGREWSGQELVGLLFRKLRDDAIALRREVCGAVVALSSSVDSAQRSALVESASLAGLTILDSIPRSTAAMIGHGLEALPATGRVLVVDVGEIAVDIGLVQRDGDALIELGALVDPTGGRRRWLEALRDKLHRAIHPSDLADVDLGPVLRQQIEDSAYDALARLAHHGDALLQAGASARRVSIDVEREALLRETWPLGVSIGRLARRAAQLGGDRRRPDAVLLVGVGARSPGVRRALQLALDVAPVTAELPHSVIARGAAWAGAARHQPNHPGLHAVPPERSTPAAPVPQVGLPEAPRGAVFSLADGGTARPAAPLQIVETTHQTLGMLAVDPEGHERVVPIIPVGTRLPATFTGRFHYAYDNMTSVKVEITEGVGAERSEVRVIGDVSLQRLPPRPRGTPIDVTWHLGEDRVLKIEVTDLETGKLGRSEITFRGALSGAERTAAAERASRLQVG
jgi:molecular chaperone DnaK